MADRKPDAWLYEGKVMVYKFTERRIDMVAKGYVETPCFYAPPKDQTNEPG